MALKILRADSYGGEIEIFERDILKKITEVSLGSSHEGRHHVSHLVDEFKHVGPHGEHVCLVFDVLGHHLYYQAVHFEAERIPAGPMKCIARQLLLGLDFLHRECGVIHTGMTTLILRIILFQAVKTPSSQTYNRRISFSNSRTQMRLYRDIYLMFLRGLTTV